MTQKNPKLHQMVAIQKGVEARVYGERNGSLWESRLQETAVPGGSAFAEFVDAVLDNRPPSATGRQGLDVQLILDAIYKSAKTNREVRIRNA